MILFKTQKAQIEFQKLDGRLRDIVHDYESLAGAHWGRDIMITSIARNDGSTHSNPPPYRFIDIALITDADNELVREIINKLYPRDDGKETVVPLNHGTAPHHHVQVPLRG